MKNKKNNNYFLEILFAVAVVIKKPTDIKSVRPHVYLITISVNIA